MTISLSEDEDPVAQRFESEPCSLKPMWKKLDMVVNAFIPTDGDAETGES